MAELTPLEKAEMGKDFQRNYENMKIQGTILVNRGEITQQEYYDKMRSKAIEYGVIREDEYPGALPGVMEDFLRVSGNIVGGVLGRNNPVAIGAGGATGQAIFDTANTFYTNYVRPGVQTKPLEQIGEDVVKAFAFDTVATKAFDSAIKGTQKVASGIKSKIGGMTDEQLRKAHKKLKDSEAASTTAESLKQAKQAQEDTIEAIAKDLEEEGIDATRYAAYGASSLHEFLKGLADVIGVIPGLSIPAKEAYKTGLRQVFDSATKGTTTRGPLFQKAAFRLSDDGKDILRNETLSDAFYENMPLTLIRQMQKQASSRATDIRNKYQSVDDDLLKLSDDFGSKANFGKYALVNIADEGQKELKTSLSKEALKLNEKLKLSAPEDIDASGQFSKFLPQEIRELIPSKKKEYKLMGLEAGLYSPKFVDQITPKQLRNLDTQLRNVIDSSRVFTAQNVAIPNAITGRDVVGLRRVIRSLIKEKDKEFGTNIAGKKLEADTAFVRRDNFLKSNQGILSFINMQNRKITDAVDFDDFVNRVNNNEIGIKYNSVGGIRVAGQDVLPNKEMTAPEMLSEYLGSERGVTALSRLMNVTDEAGNVVKSTPAFRRLVFNEIETIFDDTLFKSIRESGRFETAALRKELGFIGDGAKERFKKFDRLLKDAAKGQDEKFITMKDLEKFTRRLDKLQPDPQVRKFLMRRVALASSQSLSLGSIIPTLSAGGAAGGAAFFGGLPALGLMFLFQRFMSSKYGRGEFAKATDPKTFKGFFNKMFNATKDIADNINNKILGRLTQQGIRVGDILRFSIIDNIGQNMEILSDAQNSRDFYGNPNENPEELLREFQK